MTRILVVDDETLITMLVEEWLSELGFETIGPAHGVASAVALIERTAQIDGAILDVSLGAENCDLVADALDKRDIPYVLATGDSSSNVMPRFKDTLILTKPFDFEEMKVSLEKLLSTRPS